MSDAKATQQRPAQPQVPDQPGPDVLPSEGNPAAAAGHDEVTI